MLTYWFTWDHLQWLLCCTKLGLLTRQRPELFMPLLSPLPSLDKTMQIRHLFSKSHCLEVISVLKTHQRHSEIQRKTKELKNLLCVNELLSVWFVGVFPLFLSVFHLRAADCWKDIGFLAPWQATECAKGREYCKLQGDLEGESCSIKLGACSNRGYWETPGRGKEDRPQEKTGAMARPSYTSEQSWHNLKLLEKVTVLIKINAGSWDQLQNHSR